MHSHRESAAAGAALARTRRGRLHRHQRERQPLAVAGRGTATATATATAAAATLGAAAVARLALHSRACAHARRAKHVPGKGLLAVGIHPPETRRAIPQGYRGAHRGQRGLGVRGPHALSVQGHEEQDAELDIVFIDARAAARMVVGRPEHRHRRDRRDAQVGQQPLARRGVGLLRH